MNDDVRPPERVLPVYEARILSGHGIQDDAVDLLAQKGGGHPRGGATVAGKQHQAVVDAQGVFVGPLAQTT